MQLVAILQCHDGHRTIRNILETNTYLAQVSNWAKHRSNCSGSSCSCWTLLNFEPIHAHYCRLLRHIIANCCWQFHAATHQKAPSLPRTSWRCSKLCQTLQCKAPSVLFKTPSSGGITCWTNVLKRTLCARFIKQAGYPESQKRSISTALDFRPLLLVKSQWITGDVHWWYEGICIWGLLKDPFLVTCFWSNEGDFHSVV